MKKLLSAIFVISSLFASAQFPQGINYQSIIRNTSGVVLPSTPVTVEFKLYSSPTFTLPSVLLYDETHSATTNSFGMVNLVIGQGTPVGGLVTFNNIPWIVAGVHYEVWVNSSQVGTRQPFMSVPYAMNALTADWAPSPTLAVTGNTLSVGSNTVTIPTGPSYAAGTGISISSNTITNAAPDQTVILTGLGSATVTGTYPNFSIETPTVSPVAPPSIIGAGAATVTSAGNSFTVDVGPPVPPVIVGAGATTVTSSGNTYTVNTPAPQAYTAGNGIDITGGVISNTAAAVTPTITGMGAAVITSAGNSFTVDVPSAITPTVTGTGVAVVTPTTGNSVNVDVAAPVMTYSPPTNVLTLTQGSASTSVTLNGTGTSTVSMTGQGMASVTPATGSSFTVSVPNPTLSVAGGSISISNGNSVALPASTSLTAGNSNITLNQSGNNYTITPVAPSFVNAGPSTITGTYPNYTLTSAASPSTTLVQGNNITLNQSGNTYTVNGVTPSLSVAGNSITITPGNTVALPSHNLSTTAASLTIANGNSVAWPTHSLSVSSNSLTINGPGGNTVVMPVPTLALSGSTLTSGASTNSVNLATLPGLWSAPTATTVVTTNSLSLVGIGTNAPNAALEVAVSNSVTDGVQVNMNNVNNGGNALQVNHNGLGNAAYFSINNAGNSSMVVDASTNGSGRVINATQNGTGEAGHFFINNASNASSAVWARTTGAGPVYTAEQFGTGRGVDFRIFGSTNNQSVIYAQTVGTGPAGYFEVSNASSGNNAVIGATSGTGDAILGNHLGTSGSAGHFNIPGGSTNTSPALLATNIASGDALNANAGTGSAISASNSSSVSATMKVNQSGIGDAAVVTATQGRAIYASSNGTSGYSTAEFANSGSSTTLYAYKNTGSTAGTVASFSNNEPANGSDAVQVFNSGTGSGISVSNTNSSPTSYAGVFTGGITTKGKSNTSSDYAFRAFNSASTSLLSVRNDAIVEIGANVGINILNPTNRLHVNSSYTNAAALIENITAVSTASVAHGVLAKASSTHSLAAAVFANNLGTGPSVYGMKTASDNGIAGRFELLNTSNTADAVFALSSGSGAAVHATTGSTAGSALALWVENGHVKSTQAALPSVATVSVSGGGVSSISYTMTPGSSDVKGSMLAVITTTGIVNAGNNAVIRVTFNKNYAVAPTVIITPTSDFGQLTYYVNNVTTSSFNLVIKNSTPSNLSMGTSVPVNFNYFVIE